MRPWPLVLLLAAACGDEEPVPDGPPLGPAANVTIVAHQDDDLIFMQPDVTDVVEVRAGLLAVYVTAGEGSKTGDDAIDTAGKRDAGLRAAYAEAAGVDATWACGFIDIAGHAAEHCRLDEANVSLVFLGYPDGGKEGERTNSLLHLWEGTTLGAETVAKKRARYDQAGLIATIAEILTTAQPTTIRTLEIASTHGRDHSDHMLVGALAVLGTAAARSTAQLIAYRGYATADEPESLIDPLYDRSMNLVAHYDACATGCSACGTACPTIGDIHETWLRRRYAVATRPGARGLLRTGDVCAGISTDGAPTSAACGPSSTRWELTRDGVLTANGRCLGTLPTGETFTSTTCAPDPQRRFFLDDEGHIWFGQPPLAEADMDYAHLWCLVLAGGRPRAALCGEGQTVAWQLSDEPTTAPRPIPALPGRAVRLGDLTGDGKADLCYVDAATTLRCAPGAGDGTFGAPAMIASLAVEPESLVLADIDGDRRPDACGRDASGIVCALAGASFAASPFSPAFARSGAADATDRSLAAADADGDGKAEICGLAAQGVICAFRGQAPIVMVRSAWPMTGLPSWFADLDGDARADWCVSPGGTTGPACGLDRDRALTTDGAPWGYSFQMQIAAAPADTTVGALSDLDGDRRADLCTIRGRSIACARSQGYAFGPEIPLVTVPGAGPLTALWLGDLDGDGVVDACAEDGGNITCLRR